MTFHNLYRDLSNDVLLRLEHETRDALAEAPFGPEEDRLMIQLDALCEEIEFRTEIAEARSAGAISWIERTLWLIGGVIAGALSVGVFQ